MPSPAPDTRRVALLAPALTDTGGVPAVARFLAAAMRQSGRYEPVPLSLATAARDPASVRVTDPRTWWRGIRVLEWEWEGHSIRHIGCGFAELEPWRYRSRAPLTRILHECDLVQIVCGAPAWGRVARNARAPVLLQVATLNAWERAHQMGRWWPPAAAWRNLMARVAVRLDPGGLDLARMVFVENQRMYEHVGGRLGSDRVELIPPGVDTRRFRPMTDERTSTEPYLLTVGRLRDERKNVPLLLRAYARLQALPGPTPRLVLAGASMPAPDVLRLANDLGVRDRVELVHRPSTDRLAELYRQAAVFVLSSDEEGLGIVLLEAMASGVPVIATDCGGPATVVVDGETGFLVPVGDAETMARRLAILLDDEGLRRQMGRRARDRIERHFAHEVVGERFLEVYDRVLGSSDSRGS